jgi:hypothetical protein
MYYTFEELKDFVNSQPDEKVVDMNDNYGINTGCVLMQFVKSKNYQDTDGCGYDTIYLRAGQKLMPVSESVSNYVITIISDCINKKVKNYKEVKEILSKIN